MKIILNIKKLHYIQKENLQKILKINQIKLKILIRSMYPYILFMFILMMDLFTIKYNIYKKI